MKTIKLLALLGMIAATGCLPTFNAGVDPTPPPCGKQQPLQVVSLAYFPDPLPETLDMAYIKQWCAQHGTTERLKAALEGIPPL